MKNLTPIEQQFAIREKRYREDISNLQNTINDLTVTIKEQNVLIKRLQSEIVCKDRLIDRLTTYSNDTYKSDIQPCTPKRFSISGFFTRLLKDKNF